MTPERSLRILLADDEEIVHQTIGDYLGDTGHRIDKAYDGNGALKSIESRDYDLALIDLKMPGMDGMSLLIRIRQIRSVMPVVIITGHGTMESVIQALRLGAADFLTKPVKLLELDAVLEKCLHIRALRLESRRLHEAIGAIQASYDFRTGVRRFVGVSPATCKVREQIQQAVEAGCDTILITGETGTGKEVVARRIHYQANSEKSPFIAVSCPALAESLVESELFGHVKGAFTGATKNRAGYFELADGGALFLDEIADLSLSVQARLLRILDTRTLRRVGGSEEIKVNIRIICATNTALEELVGAGKFRRDLYYRLNVYPIHLLPLRERSQDVIPLAEHFLSIYVSARNLSFQGFSTEAKEMLLSYSFPGNARELRNIVERAAILCRFGPIRAEHLGHLKPLSGKTISQSAGSGKEKERARILKALKETKWNRRQAAEKINMPYSTLRYKMKTMGIE